MKYYTNKELSVGIVESFEVTVTEEMMDSFGRITGDINPLHNNIEYAESKGYAGKVVYGLLTASFLSTLAGVYLPGEKSLIQSIEVKFVKPVFIGDTLRIVGEVKEVNDTVNQIVLGVLIKNHEEEKVLRGVMKVGILNE